MGLFLQNSVTFCGITIVILETLFSVVGDSVHVETTVHIYTQPIIMYRTIIDIFTWTRSQIHDIIINPL